MTSVLLAYSGRELLSHRNLPHNLCPFVCYIPLTLPIFGAITGILDVTGMYLARVADFCRGAECAAVGLVTDRSLQNLRPASVRIILHIVGGKCGIAQNTNPTYAQSLSTLLHPPGGPALAATLLHRSRSCLSCHPGETSPHRTKHVENHRTNGYRECCAAWRPEVRFLACPVCRIGTTYTQRTVQEISARQLEIIPRAFMCPTAAAIR